MQVNITKLISFDIVADPGFVSARFQGYIEDINIIRKRKIRAIIRGEKFSELGI